jgi:hypothetical protein
MNLVLRKVVQSGITNVGIDIYRFYLKTYKK